MPDVQPLLHGVIQFFQATNPQISIPDAAASLIVEVRFSVAFNPHQKDLHLVAAQDAENKRFMVGERIAGKAEFGLVPTNSCAYIGDGEAWVDRAEFDHNFSRAVCFRVYALAESGLTELHRATAALDIGR